MVTAPMLNQGVKVDLPKVSSEVLPQDNDSRVLTISIKADKTYYWNMGSEVDPDQGKTTQVRGFPRRAGARCDRHHGGEQQPG